MNAASLLFLGFIPGMVAALLAVFLKKKPRVSRLLAALSLGVSAAAMAAMAMSALSGPLQVVYPWVPMWNVSFGLRVDALSGFIGATVAFLGFVDVLYSYGYADASEVGSAFYGWMALFVSAMIGVVMSTDLIQFYFLWELMLIPSSALIVYWGTGESPENPGLKYFIITHVGAVMILISFLWMMNLTGTSDLYLLADRLKSVPASSLKIMAGLLAAGFAVKMAIVPFHIWLPDAHSEAPLPVSVMLSAVMMDMGIYGMMRFLVSVFPREVLLYYSLPLMIFGVISQWYGGIEALGQTQMKRVAAYSTISQMGYVLFGIGSEQVAGLSGSVFHVLNHGLAKALLFMTIGSVIHSTGAHDLDEVGGLAKKMPVTALLGIVAAFALSGAPPMGAFHSEWRIFEGGFEAGRIVVTSLSVACSVLTAFYVLNLIIKMFFGPLVGREDIRESNWGMLGAMSFLALASLLVGIFPGALSQMVEAAVRVLGI